MLGSGRADALAWDDGLGAGASGGIVLSLIGYRGYFEVSGSGRTGPFPSWNKLVGVVTGATAIMYAFAPVSLAALQKADAGRERPYRMPAPRILLPTAFCSANLILYWGG